MHSGAGSDGAGGTGVNRRLDVSAPSCWPVYLGSILLEPNRWPDRADAVYPYLRRMTREAGTDQGPPRTVVSEWLGRAAADGFDGVELWENHALFASEAELARLADAPLPISVYNSYFNLDDDGGLRRDLALELVRKLNARAVKYNFGHERNRTAEYLRNLRAWTAQLDPSVRMIDECHSGGLYAGPADAAAMQIQLGDPRFVGTVHFKGTYDDGHSFADWVGALGPRLGHVHAPRVVEWGRDAVRRMVQTLRQHRFTGSITIEFTTGIDWGAPQPDVETLYRSAVADLRMLKETMRE